MESCRIGFLIGVGWSNIGAKAVQDALSLYFEKTEGSEEFFIGQNLLTGYKSFWAARRWEV